MAVWLTTAVIGFAVAMFALVLLVVIRFFSEIRVSIIKHFVAQGDFAAAFCALLLYAAIFAFLGSASLHFLSPAAAGSGIPTIKAFLNGVHLPKVMNVRTLAAKVVSVIFAMSSGLPLGDEGPMIHIGAMVGSGISQGRSRTLALDAGPGLFRRFRNDRERRDFVSCGAAAGVSAAFGAPVGGLLFSLEEVSSHWSTGLTWRTFVACMITTFTMNFFISWLSSCVPFGIFDARATVLFRAQQSAQYSIVDVVIFGCMGIAGGYLGGLFTKLNVLAARMRQRRHDNGPSWRIGEVVCIAVIHTIVCFWVPFLIPCKPLPTVRGESQCRVVAGSFFDDERLQFNCPSGEYNPLATLLLLPQDDIVKHLFMQNENEGFPIASLLALFIWWFVASNYTAGSYQSSGLMIPLLVTGAAYGRLVGVAVASVYGEVDAGTYALVGAAALLGGVSRMTISFTIILLEITGELEFLLPIMLAMLAAKAVGDRVNHPLYDQLLQVKAIPVLEPEPLPEMGLLTAADAASSPAICLGEETSIARILEVLTGTTHNVFPVVQGRDGCAGTAVCGAISRQTLLALLRAGAFESNNVRILNMRAEELEAIEDEVRSCDLVDPKAFAGIDAESTVVSLRRFMSLSYFAVQTSHVLTSVYELFRALGLRHVFVVGSDNHAVGVISRQDLLEWRVEELAKSVLRRRDA